MQNSLPDVSCSTLKSGAAIDPNLRRKWPNTPLVYARWFTGNNSFELCCKIRLKCEILLKITEVMLDSGPTETAGQEMNFDPVKSSQEYQSFFNILEIKPTCRKKRRIILV